MEVLLLLALLIIQIILLVNIGIDLLQDEIRLPIVVTHHVLYVAIPTIASIIMPFIRSKPVKNTSAQNKIIFARQMQLTYTFYYVSCVIMIFQTWMHLWASGLTATGSISGTSLFFKTSLLLAWIFAIINLQNFNNAIFIHSIV